MSCRRPDRAQAWRGSRGAPILAAILLAVCATAGGCRHGAGEASTPGPRLLVDGSVASDFQALAQATWARFCAVFRARQGCFGDVQLHAAYTLEGRAGYDPKTATVTVQVPRSAAMLQSGLVHEWAHHLDYQCQELELLRPAFLAAQGLPADTRWRLDYEPQDVPVDDWASIPAEQFAEATVELVLGGRVLPIGARVTDEAVRVVAAWAIGN